MSFILDAIRRSEEARHKRLIPDVSTIHAARPAAGRARPGTLPAALVMALTVALVVAGGWALVPWLRQLPLGDLLGPAAVSVPEDAVPEDAVPVDTTPVDMAPVDTAPDVAAEPAPADRAAPAPAQPVAPAVVPAVAPPVAEPPAPAAPAPAETVSAPTTAPAADPAPSGTAETKRPRRPRSSEEPAKQRREARTVAAAEPAVPPGAGGQPEPEAALAVPAPVAPESEIIAATALRDLAPSIQRTLPSIAITLHRYATSPEARMIRVNGRAAREGDEIGGDLSVAEITRSGVVFSIGGQRFYMDAFQSWQAKGGS